MKKFLALSCVLFIITACSKPIEMDCDQIFDILTQEEGTVSGIMLGDSWAEAESKMKKDHEVMIANYNEIVGSFAIDYGDENRRFDVNCILKNDIIQSIEIEIIDSKKNKSKIQKLHDRLVEHYTNEYPDEYTRIPNESSDYGKWRVMNGEEKLTIDSPTLIGNAPGATKSYKIGISLSKEI